GGVRGGIFGFRGGITVRQQFDSATLSQLRAMPSETALALVTIDLKADATFFLLKASASRRWHARTARAEFEILTTGTKWYDTRATHGGGGRLDLTMHLSHPTCVE